MSEKRHQKPLAWMLAVVLLLCAIPPPRLSAAEESLLLSDGTAGWQYAGNSVIDYTAAGTVGTGFSVEGGYGALRKLSFSMPETDLSGYDTVEWDIKAGNSRENLFEKICSAYGDSLYFRLTDASGAASSFGKREIRFVYTENGWLHAQISLHGIGIDVTRITGLALATLESNAFCTDLPAATYVLDTFRAVKRPMGEPVIEGAQANKQGEIRFLASVDRAEAERLKISAGRVFYGFLVGNAADFSETALWFGAEAPAKKYACPQLLTGENADRLYFTVTLPKQDIAETAIIRAYVGYSDQGGMTVRYSQDGFHGGYEVSADQILTEAESREVLKEMTAPVIAQEQGGSPLPAVRQTEAVAGKPFAVPLRYNPENEVCVAIYDAVRDFAAAVNDLTKDSSAAIQQALNAAKAKGGGVVYLPEGKYRCNTALAIPSGVTLRGEWLPPGETTAQTPGTVLMVYTGGITVSQAPFISLKTGGGLRNLTVFYPGIANGNIREYSPTIAETPSGGSDSYTVMNVTVLGGTVGFDAATAWSELHMLQNLYFSCLSQGVRVNDVTDIGRIERMYISPRYLLENTIQPLSAEVKETLTAYFADHADGLVIQRSDWQYVYGLFAEGLHRGVVFLPYYDASDNDRKRGSNGQMFKVEIADCGTAFDVTYTNAIGYAMTNVTVRDCGTGFRFSEEYLSSFEIAGLTFSGKVEVPLVTDGLPSGKITVTNAAFHSTGQTGYAVTVNGGGVGLQQCDFSGANRHVLLTGDTAALSVLGCTFPGLSDISRPAGAQARVKVDHTPLALPVFSGEHVFKETLPAPATADVYDVTDFGAVSGQDSTAAFQAALAAAGQTGGVVYVPQGEYFIGQALSVPSGVELRGIYDVPTHPVTKGSVLCTDYGKNNEDAPAFLSLEAGAGISGLAFYTVGQQYTDFIPYAWTVRSLGENCWAKNCVFLNSYNALDFGTNPSAGHYIRYIGGSPLRRGVFVGNNAGNGWVENVQFNPHYWKRANISFRYKTDQDQLNDAVNQTLEALLFHRAPAAPAGC